MAHDVVLKGGRVIDSTGERDADVVIGDDGRIAARRSDLSADRTLDAAGCIVSPGLVDLHSHLRQPGQEEAETIETGARAAALGGYTCILAMPNTIPAIDHAGIVREVLELGRTAPCDVRTSGAITVGRAGEQLAPLGEMAELGVRFFTDDGAGVADARLMRRAMEYAGGLRQGRRPGPALRGPGALGRRPHARGGVVVAPRASPASRPRPRSSWSCATSRSPASPAPGCTSSTCRPPGRSRWCGRRRPTGCRSPARPPPTTSRSPTPSARRTTRCSRSTRRCAPTTTWPP